MNNSFLKKLYYRHHIDDKVYRLATQIAHDYNNNYDIGLYGSLVIVPILTAAFMFAADFIRHFPIKNIINVEFLGVSSYRGTSQNENIILTKDVDKNVIENKHVLILDTVYDSGKTMDFAYKNIFKYNPLEIKTCCLVNKNENKKPDYQGYVCDKDNFIVGYGTDHDGIFRDRGDIYVLGRR